MQWLRIDLHLHTPGSSDYQEPTVTYLDILRRAEMRGLDVIAFTDHNTVAGYKNMMAEIDQLALLERLERATVEERRHLAEYRRLLDKILVLPGFEFTATFGFHILGVFAPEMPIRQIEHILLSLNIPPTTLDEGSSNVGASSDVLTAYRMINDAGGIVIAAHVNSSHGVAMRGFDFGGQTRIAYTQDAFLHALEVTDLEKRGRSLTMRFFDGTRPEYPRRMRCVQGSDAHRLIRDERNEKNLGIGDRTTEVQVDERSFEALREIFQSADFARTRPYRGPAAEVYDYVQTARETGSNLVQAFHPTLKDRVETVVADVCAMANTNGGTIYVGVSADPMQPPVGVDNLSHNIELLQNMISAKITPPIKVTIDALETQSRIVIRLQVPHGDEPPYAIEDNKIYVRDEADTTLAVRDEIVRLVTRNPRSAEAVTPAPDAPPRAQNRPAISSPFSSPFQNKQNPSAPSQGGSSQRTPPQGGTSQGNSSQGGSSQSSSSQNGQRIAAPRSAPARRGPAVNTRNVPGGSRLPAPSISAQQAAALDALPVVLPPDDFEDDDDRAAPQSRPGREAPGAGGIPQTGVEIIGTETRKGDQYHIMRDLRNGSIVKNVTRSSARQLWQYAIIERETHPIDPARVHWIGDVALLRRYRRGGNVRYDLAQRDHNSNAMRIFYGVTDSGLSGQWLQFAADDVPIEEENTP